MDTRSDAVLQAIEKAGDILDYGFTGQWAILPAMVRYDKALPANAKLIYAEIAAKINEDGYCFCYNQYFADRFGLKPDTVSSLVKRLEDAEYIQVDVCKGRINSDRRRIYLTDKPYHFNAMGGIGFKSGTVSDLNPIPIENNNLKYNTPYSPFEGDGASDDKQAPKPKRRRAAKAIPEWEPEMFERFWQVYPRGEDRQGAVREWDKLKPDRELMFTMSAALDRQRMSEDWRRGIGIPYACRWLSKRRWTDRIPESTEADGLQGGWAESREVL